MVQLIASAISTLQHNLYAAEKLLTAASSRLGLTLNGVSYSHACHHMTLNLIVSACTQEFTGAVELAKLQFDLGPISAAKEMVSRAAELTKTRQSKQRLFINLPHASHLYSETCIKRPPMGQKIVACL